MNVITKTNEANMQQFPVLHWIFTAKPHTGGLIFICEDVRFGAFKQSIREVTR